MSSVAVVTMYDAIHADAGHVPADALKVAGYVTGSPEILWTDPDWKRFPHAGKVAIDQSPDGDLYAGNKAGVYDIEANAGTPAKFAQIAASRHARDLSNCPYGSRSSLQATEQALDNVKADGWWHGMDAWLADPSLSLAEATALIGTTLFGFTLRAVQWAWPSTNPDTSVPGGTLRTLNIDLSVAEASWFPAPAPVPPAWQVQALNEAAASQVHLSNLTRILEAHQ